MAVKEKQIDTTEEIEWNVENEIQLFFAMNGHKPVGVNKYFHMVCIWEKFRAAIHRDVSLKVIWDHLESMYDLMALDDTEDLPFPSTEVDFSLPESEFSAFMKTRKKEDTDGKSKDPHQKEKHKEAKKETPSRDLKGNKETPSRESKGSKDTPSRDLKGSKEAEKKKEEVKKTGKELEMKKEKQRDVKDVKKDHKSSKGRPKGKDEMEETTSSTTKKERKDSESSRDGPKRGVKRPTRQSVDSTSKASSSPRDTPPPKRRRL